MDWLKEDHLVYFLLDLLKKAAEENAAEDERFGKDRTGDELPDELRRREDRLRVIEQAKAALEADAALTKALERKEQAAKSAAKAKESEGDKGSDARAEKAAERNFTDGDSHLMRDGSGYSQAFNCQAAVDENNQVIVAHGVSNQANDAPHLAPMLNAVVANCGAPPTTLPLMLAYGARTDDSCAQGSRLRCGNRSPRGLGDKCA